MLNTGVVRISFSFLKSFKKLDLTDRVPEDLWIQVHDIVEEAVIKTNPKKKKMKKCKMVV